MTREIFLVYQIDPPDMSEDDPFWTEWIDETIYMILEWCVPCSSLSDCDPCTSRRRKK